MNGIPVIDIFAGPGGLGEGFSALQRGSLRPFHVVCSVEKEESAHATLTLRAFYRQCLRYEGCAPPEYYAYVRGSMSRDELFDAHREFAAHACNETLGEPKALGKDNQSIDDRIREQLAGYSGPRVLIGGPPCQAYSLVGRSRNRGIAGYRIEDDPRSGLYREYLRIVDRFRPDVFIMENVKGMLSAKIDGAPLIYRILDDLNQPGKAIGKAGPSPRYRIFSLSVSKPDLFTPSFLPADFVIRSEKYGIPQARHRVILLGVREDVPINGRGLTLEVTDPALCPDLKSVLVSLPRLRSGLSKEPDSFRHWRTCLDELSQTLLSLQDPVLDPEILIQVRQATVKWRKPLHDRGGRFLPWSVNQDPGKGMLPQLAHWLIDKSLGGVLNHESRGHIRDDLARYLFCIARAQSTHWKKFKSPKLHSLPGALMPDHAERNMEKFTDRFRVQNPHAPATTVTSHISKDGHYYIHPDISQVRSFTVREAARVQTFPENYFFEGNRTQQYVQVGNAVPPLLANQIAEVVYGILT